jgi:hypothetical protein
MTDAPPQLLHAASNGRTYAIPAAEDRTLNQARVEAIELGIAADDLRDELRTLEADAIENPHMPDGYVDQRIVRLLVAAKDLNDGAWRLQAMFADVDWGAQWLPHAITAWGEVVTFCDRLATATGLQGAA